MFKTTIEKIEEKIQHVNSISDENKTELLQLLSTLKQEVAALSETRNEEVV